MFATELIYNKVINNSDASSRKGGFGAQRVKTNFNALEATAKREEKEVITPVELPKEK